MKRQTKTILDRLKRFIKFRILHINDSPHRIALGVALALFVAWMPAFGLHIPMVLSLAFLLRANKFVAFTFVWVSNPFTIFPIYYPNYLFGRTVLRLFRPDSGLSNAQIREIFDQFDSIAFFTGCFHPEFWRNLFSLLWQKVPELWLGSLLMGILVALAAYFTTYRIVVLYRKTHPHKRFLRHQ